MKYLYLLLLLSATALPHTVLAQTSAATSSAETGTPRVAHVPILIYHSVRPYYPGITNLVKEFTVPPDIFDNQISYLLNNGFTFITFDEITKFFKDGTPLPKKPIMITLDDGWENQYLYAYPILKKYKVPAVFYVYSGAIAKKHFLTWVELKDMIADHMTIAGHTRTHPVLTKVVDPVQLNSEISGSKIALEKALGVPIQDFAYPFGAFNSKDIKVVSDSGYRTARTVRTGTTADSTAPFTIDGIIITGDFNRFVSLVNK